MGFHLKASTPSSRCYQGQQGNRQLQLLAVFSVHALTRKSILTPPPCLPCVDSEKMHISNGNAFTRPHAGCLMNLRTSLPPCVVHNSQESLGGINFEQQVKETSDFLCVWQ